jgi:hypothetical protein
MLTELVKALEEKKAALEKELGKYETRENNGKQTDSNFREKERRLNMINGLSIKEYMALWQSFTPPSPFPCPFCYVFDKKISPLKTLPRVDDVESVKCTVCGELFEIPVELLYA